MKLIKTRLYVGAFLSALSACGGANNSNGTITGTVAAGAGNCASGPVTVSLYSGSTVAQTTSVNPGATFSFSAAPGAYTVGAQTTAGCGNAATLSISGGQTGNVSLALTQGGVSSPAGVAAGGTGAALTGVIAAGPGTCASGTVTVTAYSGSTVAAQTSVGVGATYSMQISPGTYTITAQSSTGCGATTTASPVQGQTATISMTLAQGGGSYSPYGTTGYPTTGYGGYPNPYPSVNPLYPYGAAGTVPGINPFTGLPPQPGWAPPVTYPYVWQQGPGGAGFYFWNLSAGPCTFANGAWSCNNP
jgi:hypothetical protein